MAFGTAPDLAFGPDGMLPQLPDRRMIVVGDLVGQGKVGGVEDARLAAEELEQACRLLDDEPRIGAFAQRAIRSEEHTSELQSLMRISYAVFCLKKKKPRKRN